MKMNKEDFEEIVNFIQHNYRIRLQDTELKLLKDILRDCTFETFKNEIRYKLINQVDYFSIQALRGILINGKADTHLDINCNWNSCYWYEIEREWCEKNNHPYYDIIKGPDYPLPPFKE